MGAVAGAHNIKQNESTTQSTGLIKFQRHPQYNSNNIKNDIAILEFTTPMTINDYVKPIALPAAQTGEWMVEGELIDVCGWGNTNAIGASNYPAELHCVDTKYVPVATCNSRESYNGSILDGMFCAGELGVGGKDACQGDSGGPIVNPRENASAPLHGDTDVPSP